MDDMNKILEILKLNIDTPLYLNYKDMGKTDVIKKVIEILENLKEN